jgi:hypothetical protein
MAKSLIFVNLKTGGLAVVNEVDIRVHPIQAPVIDLTFDAGLDWTARQKGV